MAAATPARLDELAGDAGYVEAVEAAVAREAARLGAGAWYGALPADGRARSPTCRPSSASATPCRSTRAASACSPATT